jgi:hypothetical protein
MAVPAHMNFVTFSKDVVERLSYILVTNDQHISSCLQLPLDQPP